MKRSCGKMIDINASSDDDSTKDQPDKPNVIIPIMEAERIAQSMPTSQELLELQKQVAKLENEKQGACRYARQFEMKLEESQKRVEFLENLLDKKPVVDGMAQKRIEEDARKAAASSISFLTQQLIEEKRRAKEDRSRYEERIEVLTSKLALYEGGLQQSQLRLQPFPPTHNPFACFPAPPSQQVLELQRNVIKLEQNFQDACRCAREFELRMEDALKHVAFLENILAIRPDMDKQRVEELQKKLADTAKELHEVKKDYVDKIDILKQHMEEKERVSEDRKIDQAIIEVLTNNRDELELKLAQYEVVLEQLQRVIPPPSIESIPLPPGCDTTSQKSSLQPTVAIPAVALDYDSDAGDDTSSVEMSISDEDEAPLMIKVEIEDEEEDVQDMAEVCFSEQVDEIEEGEIIEW